MDTWLASDIVVADLDGLQQAISNHLNDRHTWSYRSDPGPYLYGDGDNFGNVDALADFARYIKSGYVQGVDYDGQPVRFVFVDGTVKKMVPQWIEDKSGI